MTKKIIIKILIIAFLICQTACQSPKTNPLNLDFEEPDIVGRLPFRWTVWGGRNSFEKYKYGIDSEIKKSGNNSIFIESVSDDVENDFGCLATAFPVKFSADEVKLNGYIKLNEVSQKAGFVVRIDGKIGQVLNINPLETQHLNGTSDWTPHSVTLSIPPDAETIYISACLAGKGKIWVDNLEVLVDRKDFSLIDFSLTKTKILGLSIFSFFFLSLIFISSKVGSINLIFTNLSKLSLAIGKQQIILITVFIGLIWLVVFLGGFVIEQQNKKTFYFLLELPLTFLLFGVSLMIYFLRKDANSIPEKKNVETNDDYTKEKIEHITEILQKAMTEDRLFIDPELSLKKVAAHINCSARDISFVLNNYLNFGFVEFVNKFRVEEVKQKLSQPESKKLTILAIAFEAGFNSPSTFQRVFKETTGLTPKQFQEENLPKDKISSK